MDTGREGFSKGKVCGPDGAPFRGVHPDVPGLWAWMLEDAGRKEPLPGKTDQS